MTGGGRVARLRRRLYAFAFADELGPLYAIYPLWFADSGLTVAEISVAYMVWGTVELLCEVPSGALADLLDRRRLLAFALLLRVVGIGVWIFWPSFSGIIVGAALWAVHSALASGTWEALVYDELAHHDAEDDYATVIARIEQASHLATAASMLSAAALVAIGVTLVSQAWLSLALCLPAIALILTIPRANSDDDAAPHQALDEEADSAFGVKAWGNQLKLGLRDARSTPQTWRLVGLGGLLAGLFIVDEYVHLLGRVRGLPEASIPLLVAAVWGGLLLGGELAARKPNLSPRSLAILLAGGAALMGLGLLSTEGWPLLLVAVGYGAMQTTWLLSDARLQALLPSETRATVTSVRALGSGLVSVGALAAIGALALGEDPTPGLLGVALLLGLAGLGVRAWVPEATDVQPADAVVEAEEG